jgi:outer membrane protein assembly factor BamD
MKYAICYAGLLTALLSAGCSLMPWNKDKGEEEADANATEQVLYNYAQRSLRAGNYQEAIEQLEQLEANFPFGRYAEQAQLEIVFAHYMSFDPDAARSAADRFIRLHPQHPNVDYAHYLKGLAAYHRDRGVFDRLVTTDVAKRDMTSNHEAYRDFSTLLELFPNSAYAPDARQRMVYLRNVLARSELAIANHYMERGAYIAAANRARFIIENYPRAEAMPDALAVLVEANFKLGMTEATDDALKVLATNYPDYQAFDENGDLVLKEQIRSRDRSWTNLVTFGLLDRPPVPPPIRLSTRDESASDGAAPARP